MNNVKCQRKKAVKNNFSGISYSGRIMWCQIIWTPSETKVNQCVNGDFTTYYCVIKSPIEIRSFCSFPSISAKTGNLFAILHNHQDSSSPSWFLVLYSTVIWNSEFHSENFVYWGYARFIYSKINTVWSVNDGAAGDPNHMFYIHIYNQKCPKIIKIWPIVCLEKV